MNSPTGLRPLPVLLLVAGLTACGGGGGGFDDEDDFFQILAYYDYAVTNPAGAPPPLTRTIVNAGSPTNVYSIDAGTGTVRGRYFTADRNLSFTNTSTYTVNWSGGGPLPALLFVGVTANGSFPTGNFIPVSGALAITWGLETITVQYGNAVQIALNEGVPLQFTPFAFSELDLDTAAPDWQRVASRASRALVDLLTEVRNNVGFLERVYNGDLDSGQAVTACTTIPGTPPPGVTNQTGEIIAQELNTRNYRNTANECFMSATPNFGLLLDGTVDLRNLATTVDNGVLVGFSLLGAPGQPGGVSFDFDLISLQQTLPGVWNFSGGQRSTTGGYNLAFQYPPN